MKKLLLLTLMAGSLSATAQTNYPGSISGCIARWDFAQSPGPVTSLPDVSGNGHNSSAVNSLTSTLGFRNVANKGMVFNGFSSSATVPHATALQPTAITMIALVWFNSFYAGPCQGNYIISKGLDQTSGCYSLVVNDNIYDGSCAVNSPGYKQFMAGYGTNVNGSLPLGNYVTTGQWYFLAASYDGTTAKHYQVVMDPNNYVSGITPAFTANVPGSIGSNTGTVMIGNHFTGPYTYPFSGIMDEVALFNRVLTNAEVQSVYDYLWGIVAVTSVPANLCPGQPFNVTYSVNNTTFFAASNVFTVQLSDASGSFTTPTNIGSVTATGGGTISCTIPGTVPNGTGYRIRIVGSNVAYTGRDNGTNLNVGGGVAKPSIGSNSPVCAGQTLNLSGSSSTPGVTYNWSGPLGFSSNQQNPSIPGTTTAHAGNYTLYTTLNGCTSQIDTEVVAVGSNTPPSVVSYASPGDTICVGGTAAFYALVTSGANPQYQWMKNGSPVVGETSPTYVTKLLNNGDVIHCQITTTGCSSMLTANSNSHTIAIVGKTPAGVSISANPGLVLSPWQTVTFTANVTNGGLTPIYQWKLNGNDIPGATGQTWSANNLVNNDAVSVVVRSSSDCAEPAIVASQVSIVNINTSVDGVSKENDISIYPNPNNGAFTVTFKDAPPVDGQIEVMNAVGQIVYHQQYMVRSSSVVIDMPQVAQGVYLVKMDIDGKSYRSRIVISK